MDSVPHPSSARRPGPRNPTLPRGAHRAVVWVPPASHRLCSYGELGALDRTERWWRRRIALLVMVLLLSYPCSVGWGRVLVRMTPGAWAGQVDVAFASYARPWSVVEWGCPPVGGLDDLVEQGLLWLTTTTGPTVGGLTVAGLMAGLLYALSPLPSWLVARLCLFDQPPLWPAVLAACYAPLTWLADRSRTCHEFYTDYFAFQEDWD